MNKDKLRALCHKIAKEAGLSFNSVQTHFFLESILEKIAISVENEYFIFKGGFLLANVVGIKQRNTVDIDFSIRKFTLTKDNIKNRFEKILQNSVDDDITYEIQKIEEIRKEDEYGGFRLNILCKLENIRQIIPLDIATGDPVTPDNIKYEYKSIFEDKCFKIYAYNIETILAEKIHTVYKRGVFNSRSKDFYDIFIIYHLKKEEIAYENLKTACINTFNYRNTKFDIQDIITVLNILKDDRNIKIRWKSYQKRFNYADEIAFEYVIESILNLVNRIN